MKIFLLGYMGCGKSTLGKKLADAIDLPFYDTDTLIEKETGKSISDLFTELGESAFRELERATLERLSKLDAGIVSLGGGLPCYKNNMEIILPQGISVYLQLTVKELMQRLSPPQQRAKRPLLAELSSDELYAKIENQLDERASFYQQAQIHLTKNEQTIPFLIERLKTLTPP